MLIKLAATLTIGLIAGRIGIPASALSINGNFVAPGDEIPLPGLPSFVAQAPPPQAGGGSLPDIFQVAGDRWEAFLLDDVSLSITFAWVDFAGVLPANILAAAPVFETQFPPNQAFIGFSNQFEWFADETPLLNEEYEESEALFADLGGGLLNTGRTYSATDTAARDRHDLYSVALHEIGHSLGFLSANPAFGVPGNPRLTVPNLTISSPRPFFGTILPTTLDGGGHLQISSSSLFPAFARGRRKLLTDADILAVAEVSQFERVFLPSQSIFESNYSFSFWIGFGVLLMWSKEKFYR